MKKLSNGLCEKKIHYSNVIMTLLNRELIMRRKVVTLVNLFGASDKNVIKIQGAVIKVNKKLL